MPRYCWLVAVNSEVRWLRSGNGAFAGRAVRSSVDAHVHAGHRVRLHVHLHDAVIVAAVSAPAAGGERRRRRRSLRAGGPSLPRRQRPPERAGHGAGVARLRRRTPQRCVTASRLVQTTHTHTHTHTPTHTHTHTHIPDSCNREHYVSIDLTPTASVIKKTALTLPTKMYYEQLINNNGNE